MTRQSLSQLFGRLSQKAAHHVLNPCGIAPPLVPSPRSDQRAVLAGRSERPVNTRSHDQIEVLLEGAAQRIQQPIAAALDLDGWISADSRQGWTDRDLVASELERLRLRRFEDEAGLGVNPIQQTVAVLHPVPLQHPSRRA